MLICPVCKKVLFLNDRSYICENRHTFDLAKKGYVNLLMSSSARTHGDDKIMADARRDFLDTGFYKPLRDKICEIITGGTVLDLGCGEGYYTEGITADEIYAMDISKDAISGACRRLRGKNVVTCVAGCADIPLESDSCDYVLSVFAPVKDSELLRIIKPRGKVVRVTPGIDHLFELKSAVYDNPLKNTPIDMTLCGFEITKTYGVSYNVTLDKEQAKSLFTMTPYYYKTSLSDISKLDSIETLDVTAQFDITVYEADK